jgi:hypothetical protein
MPKYISLEPQLPVDALERRYRGATDPHERSWQQILWLLAKGQTATAIAKSTGYSRYWIGQVARGYNEQGPAGRTIGAAPSRIVPRRCSRRTNWPSWQQPCAARRRTGPSG